MNRKHKRPRVRRIRGQAVLPDLLLFAADHIIQCVEDLINVIWRLFAALVKQKGDKQTPPGTNDITQTED